MQLGSLTITVRNMEASVSFYQGLLGMTRVSPPEAFTSVQDSVWLCMGQGSYLQLAPLPVGQPEELVTTGIGVYPQGFHHLCLSVSDIREYYEIICRAGWPLERELLQGTDHNWQFWLRDPDGYPVEFMEMNPNSMQYIYRGNGT